MNLFYDTCALLDAQKEAFETEDAYIFNDSKHIYDGWIPIVIRKSDGHRVHYGEYMLGDDQTWTYRKKIKF